MNLRLSAVILFALLCMGFTACIEFNDIGAEGQPCGKNGGCWDDFECCSDDICRKSCQGDGDWLDGDVADGDIADGDTDGDVPDGDIVDGDIPDGDIIDSDTTDSETDLCSPDPCNGHGSCDPVDGSCTCINLYDGQNCDRCAANYAGYPDCVLAHTQGFVSISAGPFWMGAPDGCPGPEGYLGDCEAEVGSEPLHEVYLSYDFEMSIYEATQRDWSRYFPSWNPSSFQPCDAAAGSLCPLETVSWYDAVAYANECSADAGLPPCYVFSNVTCEDGSTQGDNYMACMNATQGGIENATVSLWEGVSKPQECKGYRLPTEAEWEYAIRSGKEYTAFYQSNENDGTITHTGTSPVDPNLAKIGWYGGNASSTTHPVGGRDPNAWGIFDMSGNVLEWVWDYYQLDYQNDTETDPAGLSTGSTRVLRGGNWNGNAQGCRSARRHDEPPGVNYDGIGFRLVRTLHVTSCDPDPCNGHGTCDLVDGSCDCMNPYDGESCDECAPHFTSYPNCQWDGTFPEGYCDSHICWKVPPTGQKACYGWDEPYGEVSCPGVAGSESCGSTPGCGQDAQYADNPRNFNCYNADGGLLDCETIPTASENEVVTDSLTGLMWQRYLPETYSGCSGGDPEGAECTWQEAVEYCEELNYGNHQDWRLPNPHELQSIVDDRRVDPTIDIVAFPDTPSGFFWSSLAYSKEVNTLAWEVYFVNGYVVNGLKVDPKNVRCVRAGPPESSLGSFDIWIISGATDSEVVIDVVTELIWQNSSVTGKTWQQALAYCEALDYAAHTDWRLPNKKELMSLINYENYKPASDFPEMLSSLFWSSSSGTNGAWYVSSIDGYVEYYGKNNSLSVRCVRGEP